MLLDASCLSDGRAAAGIGRYAREIIAALTERDDIDVEVAVPTGPPRSESRPGRFLHAHPTVLRAAKRWKPHLLHGLGGEPVLGFPLDRQVITVRDVEMWRDMRATGSRRIVLRAYAGALLNLYRRCARIVAVSRTTAEEAIATLRLDASRVRVVPHGVSGHFSAEAGPRDAKIRASLGLVDPYVAWTGSLRHHDPRKGLDTLLDAMAQLGGAASLALAGAPGDESRRIAAEAERLGVQAILCGALDDGSLAAMYRGTLALAMPSLHEGFGLPALEAMACGAPVVATTAGNLPDLAGGAARLVPPRDAAALAEQLRALLGSPKLARQAGAAGVLRAAGYSWSRSAELTAAVYREIARTA